MNKINYSKLLSTKLIAALFLLLSVYSFNTQVYAHDGGRVLLYHSVSKEITDTTIATLMPFETFEWQMRFLRDAGYTAVTVSEMFDSLSEGTLPEKTVAITFDDGYLNIYEEVFPLLKELGFPATTYIVGRTIDAPKSLTGEMLREMYEAGWEIGSHSMSHGDLPSTEDLNYEICFSRQAISSASGIPLEDVVSFAYPYGSADERTMTKVYKCGFKNGGGLGNMLVTSNSNKYYFARYSMYADTSPEAFEKLF